MQREKLDVAAVRQDFPMLGRQLRGRPLVYLDSAATSQKPGVVIDALRRFYEERCATVHRGVHALAAEATAAYEAARGKVARFLGARAPGEVVFTRGTTEAINLVAHSFGRRLERGDEIVVSEMEHHSNIVPWQMLCQRTGAVLRVLPVDDRGELALGALDGLLGPRTRLLALTHVSNVLGTVNPVAEVCAAAHNVGALVLVDGAQAVPHLEVDVQSLDCDFYAFSGHKLYAPTGIGALWGRAELYADMPPFQGGGDMILSVSFAGTVYQEPPYRFEAGTPAVGEAIALGVAIDYLDALGRRRIAAHEGALLARTEAALAATPGVRVLGAPASRAGVVSFVVDRLHPHDLGTLLDFEGIAIRTGHHCAQPLMERLGVPATARVSLALYNTEEEIDALVAAVDRARGALA